MELTDRQNWALSGAVGVLFVVNSVLWLLFEDDIIWQAAGLLLVFGGLLATFNSIQAIRGVQGVEPMEWTLKKTLVNVVVVVLLVLAIVYWAMLYA